MQVFACDIDAEQLEMAKRNCEAYGVADRVSWLVGDVFKCAVDKVDSVFLSPPWGGPGGIKSSGFDATHPLPGVSWCAPLHACIWSACFHIARMLCIERRPLLVTSHWKRRNALKHDDRA
jgi:tRNA G10  N-methylase Trm11